jgi:hypothetical protein
MCVELCIPYPEFGAEESTHVERECRESKNLVDMRLPLRVLFWMIAPLSRQPHVRSTTEASVSIALGFQGSGERGVFAWCQVRDVHYDPTFFDCEPVDSRCGIGHSVVHNRRAKLVKAFTRGLCWALVSLSLIGMTGCGSDNESEAEKLSKEMGDPGAANPKGLPADIKEGPPGSMEDVKRNAEENAKKLYGKGSAYPGAGKGKK